MRHLPLDGVRIVDFSWVMAGPMATKMLGAMGAEVIKIESSRRPEFSQRDGMFSVINRNKKSCTLNITTPEGQQLVRDLVAESDVLVENFSGGVLRKYGLAYENLQPINPDLVFVSASGLGRTGPQRDALAYGSLLQGYSGRVSMIGKLNPALEAMGILPAWTDPITALWEVFAILTALRHRANTGEGAYVDLSMLESTVALLPRALLGAALRESGVQCDNMEFDAAPAGCFRCAGKDEWLAVSIHTDAQWRALCGVMARPDLLQDPTFAHTGGRLQAKAALDDHLARWLATRSAGEVELLLQQQGIPAARSRHIGELVHDEHMKRRGVFRSFNGELEMGPLPWLAGEAWRGHSSPSPAMGADNEYVFGEILGLSASRQQELQQAGVIQ
ncbi:MAG TPA: CoA transferase [Casimicrobiaceae bacterium]|nr:CoA transferase [Casimicrobiaceae bacterium]